MEPPPSISGAGSRVKSAEYDPAGNPIDLRAAGVEARSQFLSNRALVFNGAGMPVSIELPGHAVGDITTVANDASRGELLRLTRIDPLVGTMSFSCDALCRMTPLEGNRVTNEYGAAGVSVVRNTGVDNGWRDLASRKGR